MNRTDIINRYIEEFEYKNYLEIGVQNGMNIIKINCENKTGVDPDAEYKSDEMHEMTSDEFFKNNKEIFDIIFIDGLHESEQVKKDIENSLNCITECGTIVCHDMLPPDENHQKVPRIQKQWTGDCWKAFVRLRIERNDLRMYVIDKDYGVGIIQDGNQHKLNDVKEEDLTWDNFVKNKDFWMNIKPIQI